MGRRKKEDTRDEVKILTVIDDSRLKKFGVSRRISSALNVRCKGAAEEAAKEEEEHFALAEEVSKVEVAANKAFFDVTDVGEVFLFVICFILESIFRFDLQFRCYSTFSSQCVLKK